MPTSRYVGTFVNPSIGTLIFEGNASALVVRFGDSWGLARTVRRAGRRAGARRDRRQRPRRRHAVRVEIRGRRGGE